MHQTTRGLLWASVAIGVPWAITSIIAHRSGMLEAPLPGEIGYYEWVYGRVAFYRMGRGTPLLLVHHPHPGGSSWEWRKVFPELANHHTVYALDLLGFGLSEKPNIPYSGAMFADLLHDFAQDVIGHPAMAIGSVLGASYLVNVAVRRPEALSRLVLVNPTGIVPPHLSVPMEEATWLTLHTPVVGTSLYYALVSRAAIEQALRVHYYHDPSMVTSGLVDYIHTAAHQPGSQYAAAAFLAGRLNLPMRMAFAALTQPTQMFWGREAFFTPLSDAADLLYRDPRASLEVVADCGMFPHDEKAGAFLQGVQAFETTVDSAAA